VIPTRRLAVYYGDGENRSIHDRPVPKVQRVDARTLVYDLFKDLCKKEIVRG
jgi:hypothetical protein